MRNSNSSGSFSGLFIDKSDYSEIAFAYRFNPLGVSIQIDKNDIKLPKNLIKKSYAFKYDSTHYFEYSQVKPKYKQLDRGIGLKLFLKWASFDEIITSHISSITDYDMQQIKIINDEFKIRKLKGKTKMKCIIARALARGLSPYPDRFPMYSQSMFIEIIREHPDLLIRKDYAYEFISILDTARWNIDKKKRDDATRLLQRHLFYKRIGGKHILPPGIDLMKEVCLEIAFYLSGLCKNQAKEMSISTRNGHKLTKDEYKAITEWAREQKEYRISTLSMNALSCLIYKPAIFVQDILEKHFHVSLKTIDRTTR